jgi:hypothetical protein
MNLNENILSNKYIIFGRILYYRFPPFYIQLAELRCEIRKRGCFYACDAVLSDLATRQCKEIKEFKEFKEIEEAETSAQTGARHSD